MIEIKWPTKQSVSDAIDFSTMEYQTAGARVIMEKTATLAEQVQADMMVVVSAQAAEIERLTAENAALIEWGKAAYEFIDARSGGWLANEAPPQVKP